jgi:urate oxidase
MSLLYDRYGKSRVRIVKVDRGDMHRVKEITADVLCEGDFAAAYTQGSNKDIVATDTMKNLCYILAQQHEVDPIEKFAVIIAQTMLSRYEQVGKVTVELTEHLWDRVSLPDKTGLQSNVTTDAYPDQLQPQTHAFIRRQPEVRICVVKAARGVSPVILSRIADLQILKTTGSSFTGFYKCEYTTLPEAKDRNFCTSLKAEWSYNTLDVDYNATYLGVRNTLIDIFANKPSNSVQQTLHDMGTSCLSKFKQLESIHLWLPNIHFPPVDFTRFQMKNEDKVYQPINDPSGYIEGIITRPRSRL